VSTRGLKSLVLLSAWRKSRAEAQDDDDDDIETVRFIEWKHFARRRNAWWNGDQDSSAKKGRLSVFERRW
jgi:hypothetical protein